MSGISFLFCLGLIVWANAKPQTSGRIVGGEYAVEGAFPYQASLRYDGSHLCGASIISRRYMLSAAHCVGDEDDEGNYFVYAAEHFSIRAGSSNRLLGGVVKKVIKIVVNENYANFLHDLAVLTLETPLIYSNNIQPIPLASAEVPTGDNVIISGWGYTATNAYASNKLKWNTVQTLSRLSCLTTIGMASDAVLCLGHSVDNGACFGDSGGPAAYQGELVGVASFVVGGCGTSNPDGYAKVFKHLDWIKEHSDL
uniref:Serine protease SP24D n=1 Tax=Bactrocera latifrons TaxID=174628 RepID=A0A0K8U836_BACLA